MCLKIAEKEQVAVVKIAGKDFFREHDVELPAEELRLVSEARRFSSEDLGPEARRAFAAGEPFDRGIVGRWASLGMLGLQVDRSEGGLGASYLCKVRVAQELAVHGFAAAFCLNNMQGIATRLSRHGNARQKTELLAGLVSGRWLGAPAMTEPGGGSDLGALTSSVVPVQGGWVLNGTKAWVSNGLIVDWVTLLARAPDGARSDIASFLVPCVGASVQRAEMPMPGAHSFRLAEISFRDHFVPDWALLHPPGTALKASLDSINAARVHVAAMCVATLLGAFRTALEYCGSRVAFRKTLLEHQGLRWSLADVAIRLEAADALVHRATRAVQRGDDVTVLAAQAKVFAVSGALDGIEACMRAMGAIGASAVHPLAMHAAEVRLATYADGTDEVLRDRVGQRLLSTYVGV